MRVRNILMTVLPPFLRTYAAKVEASPLGYRLARGVFWSLAGAAISRGLGIVSSIVVARVLGKVGFGELGIINSTVLMFQTFAGFSLGTTAAKYVAEYRSNDPQRAGRVIALAWVISAVTGGLCTFILFVFGPWLAGNTLAAPQLAGPLRVASIIIFISALNGSQAGALNGFEAFKALARINVVLGLLTFPLMIIGVLWGGLQGAIWAMVASAAVGWFLCHMAIRYEARRFGVPLKLAGCFQELSILWRFSVPAVLGGLMVMPVSWVCNSLLVNQRNGYAEMGLLNAANQWYNALLFVPGILAGPILPVLSERLGAGAARQSRRIIGLSIGLNALVVLPISLIGCVASPLIMRLYGDSFVGGWPVLAVTLVTATVLAILYPVGQLIIASGWMWLGFLTNLLWAIVILSMTVLWVRFGSLGVSSAKFVAYFCHAIWTLGVAYVIIRKLQRSTDLSNSEPRIR